MTRDDLEQGTPLSRRTAFGVVAAIVAIPALYVAARYGHGVARPDAFSAPPAAQIAKADAGVADRLTQSLSYMNSGSPGKAVPLLKAMLAENPRDATAWNNLCVADMGLQEFNHAVDACEAGIRANGNMPLPKNNLKWAQDELEKAKIDAARESAKPRDTRTVESFMKEGLDHLHVGEYHEAQSAWYQCLSLDPHNAVAQNNIGVAFMLLNQPADAAQSFAKAVADDDSSALYKANLAWAQQTK